MIGHMRRCLKRPGPPTVAGATNSRWSLQIAALCTLGLAACVPPAKELANPDAGEPPAEARTCFGTEIPQLCLETPPDQALLQLPATDPTRPAQIDTDSACTAVHGGDYCVVAAITIEVTAPIRVIGKRPLVLIASRSIKLFSSGSIDVGGAAPDACNAGRFPGMDSGTGGGGAGGTFMTLGGQGGDGDTVFSGPAGGHGGSAGSGPRLPLSTLRGGCAGQDGAGAGSPGGHGGGAVLLIAQDTIDLSEGSLCAGGAGGGGGQPINNNMASSGGGGGGAGGMIGLDAPMIITGMRTMIHADGGGGGEGSSFTAPGSAGSDALCSSPASGGGHNPTGGDGGAGSSYAGNGTSGKTGMFGGANGERGGGGGGGGGAGIIIVRPNVTLKGDVSPQPTVTVIGSSAAGPSA